MPLPIGQLPVASVQRYAAAAPGKVILFGEHAINRGQPAVATAVGLRTRCALKAGVSEGRASLATPPADGAGSVAFASGPKKSACCWQEIFDLGKQIDAWRAAQDYEAIRALKARDFFAPQKYILTSMFAGACPGSLELEWQSEVPASSGLGSGGSAFVSMAGALSRLLPAKPALEQRADWAHRGDVVAHGGIASALDTQTSLLGGVVLFTGRGLAESLPCAPGLNLVIAHTGVSAPTSEVNARVRRWLEESPAVRLHAFQTIGALTRAAIPCLASGSWDELGRLMNLNQLVLEKIGVGCPESARLIEAALGAGALGAKISGSGGGGIIIALAPLARKQPIAEALAAAGGKVFTPEIGVPGASAIETEPA